MSGLRVAAESAQAATAWSATGDSALSVTLTLRQSGPWPDWRGSSRAAWPVST